MSDGWVGVVCPWCGVEGKPGLGINARSLACSCFKCGRHRVGETLAALTGKPVREVLSMLPGVDPDVSAPDRPAGVYTPPPGVGPLLPAHRAYLESRGYDPDRLASEWGVRGIGHDGGVYAWRLFMPVPVNGQPATWTTRAVGDATPRYRSARPEHESHPLKKTLYGWHHVRHAVVVVEGPFDAIRVGPGAAATCGLTVTAAQVRLIASVPTRVVCFDSDPAAQARARDLADRLAPFPGRTFVVELSGKDPDTSPPAELAELRNRFLE